MARSYDYRKTWLKEYEVQRAHLAVGAAIEVGDYTDLPYAREVLAQLLADVMYEDQDDY